MHGQPVLSLSPTMSLAEQLRLLDMPELAADTTAGLQEYLNKIVKQLFKNRFQNKRAEDKLPIRTVVFYCKVMRKLGYFSDFILSARVIRRQNSRAVIPTYETDSLIDAYPAVDAVELYNKLHSLPGTLTKAQLGFMTHDERDGTAAKVLNFIRLLSEVATNEEVICKFAALKQNIAADGSHQPPPSVGRAASSSAPDPSLQQEKEKPTQQLPTAEAKIAKLEGENASLRAETSRLQETKEFESTERDSFTEELARLTKEKAVYEQQTREMEQLHKQLQELHQTNASLKQELNETKQTAAQIVDTKPLHAELDQLRTQNLQQQQELTEYKRSLFEAQKELGEKDSELQSAQAQLAKSKRKLTTANQELSEKDSELQTTQTKLAESKRKLTTANQELTEKDSELQTTQTKLAESKRKLTTATELRTKLMAATQATSAAQQLAEQKEQELQTKSKTIEELTGKLNQVREERDQAKERITVLENNVVLVTQQLRRHQQTITTLQTKTERTKTAAATTADSNLGQFSMFRPDDAKSTYTMAADDRPPRHRHHHRHHKKHDDARSTYTMAAYTPHDSRPPQGGGLPFLRTHSHAPSEAPTAATFKVKRTKQGDINELTEYLRPARFVFIERCMGIYLSSRKDPSVQNLVGELIWRIILQPDKDPRDVIRAFATDMQLPEDHSVSTLTTRLLASIVELAPEDKFSVTSDYARKIRTLYSNDGCYLPQGQGQLDAGFFYNKARALKRMSDPGNEISISPLLSTREELAYGAKPSERKRASSHDHYGEGSRNEKSRRTTHHRSP